MEAHALILDGENDGDVERVVAELNERSDIENVVFKDTEFSGQNTCKILHALQHHEQLRNVCFDGQVLCQKAVEWLGALMMPEYSVFTSLYVKNVRMSNMVMEALTRVIRAQRDRLERLTIGGSIAGASNEHANALFKAIGDSESIDYLCFDDVHIGYSVTTMFGYMLARTRASTLVFNDFTVAHSRHLMGFLMTTLGKTPLKTLTFRQQDVMSKCTSTYIDMLYALAAAYRCNVVQFIGIQFYNAHLNSIMACLKNTQMVFPRVDFIACRFQQRVYNEVAMALSYRRCKHLRFLDNVVAFCNRVKSLYTFSDSEGLAILAVRVSGEYAYARSYVQGLCLSMCFNHDICGLSLHLKDFAIPVIVEPFLDVNKRLQHLDVQGQWPVGLERFEGVSNSSLTHLRCATPTCALPLSRFTALECIIMKNCNVDELRHCTSLRRVYIDGSAHLLDQLCTLSMDDVTYIEKLVVGVDSAPSNYMKDLFALINKNNKRLQSIVCRDYQNELEYSFKQ